MNGILKTVLSLSLSGSLLIPVLLVCRPLIKNAVSKRWRYYIWLVVIARLLLPFTPETSPVGTLFRGTGTDTPRTGTVPLYERNAAPAAQPGNDWETEENHGARDGRLPVSSIRKTLTRVLRNLWLVWLAAALILLIRKITIYQDFVRYIEAGSTEVSDTVLLDRLAQTGEQAGVKRPIELYTNSLISSPLLLGFFRPRIVLPTAGLSQSDFKYTILHELVHYRRRDMFYKWLVQLTVCLHWFNPLVYLMGREIDRMCELACDEAVIRELDAQEQRAYGDTLIRAAGAGGSYKDFPASVTLGESRKLLKERLGAIMDYRKKSKTAICVSGVLTVMFLCGAVFMGAYADTGKAAANSGGNMREQNRPAEQITGNIHRAQDDIPTDTARADSFTPASRPNVEITIDTDAAVDFVHTSDSEITVDYGKTLYDVSVDNENGNWKIHIAYTGSYSAYPAAVLRIPDIVYENVDLQIEQATVFFDRVFRNGKNISAHMRDCSVFYTVPAGFAGTLNAAAPDCYFELHSANGYENCAVTVANGATFGNIPDGFTKRGNSLVYSSGTPRGTINVDLENSGYVVIE